MRFTRFTIPKSNDLDSRFSVNLADTGSIASQVSRAMLDAYRAGMISCFVDDEEQPTWACQAEQYDRDEFLANAKYPVFSEFGSPLQANSGKGKRAVYWNYALRLDRRSFVMRQNYSNCTFCSLAEGMNLMRGFRQLGLGLSDDWKSRHGTVWYCLRGHCGNGSSLSSAANAITRYGLQLRMSYCGGKYDFTDEDYDEKCGQKWCRSGPPDDLAKETQKALHHTVSFERDVTADVVRDTLFNGGFIHHGSSRTGTGGSPVGGLQRIGAHAQAVLGYDDTDEWREWYERTAGVKARPHDFPVINDNTWGPGWISVKNWPSHLWGAYPEGAWVAWYSDMAKAILPSSYIYLPNTDGFQPNPVDWNFLGESNENAQTAQGVPAATVAA